MGGQRRQGLLKACQLPLRVVRRGQARLGAPHAPKPRSPVPAHQRVCDPRVCRLCGLSILPRNRASTARARLPKTGVRGVPAGPGLGAAAGRPLCSPRPVWAARGPRRLCRTARCPPSWALASPPPAAPKRAQERLTGVCLTAPQGRHPWGRAQHVHAGPASVGLALTRTAPRRSPAPRSTQRVHRSERPTARQRPGGGSGSRAVPACARARALATQPGQTRWPLQRVHARSQQPACPRRHPLVSRRRKLGVAGNCSCARRAAPAPEAGRARLPATVCAAAHGTDRSARRPLTGPLPPPRPPPPQAP